MRVRPPMIVSHLYLGELGCPPLKMAGDGTPNAFNEKRSSCLLLVVHCNAGVLFALRIGPVRGDRARLTIRGEHDVRSQDNLSAHRTVTLGFCSQTSVEKRGPHVEPATV